VQVQRHAHERDLNRHEGRQHVAPEAEIQQAVQKV
jgi:hypothetical protein